MIFILFFLLINYQSYDGESTTNKHEYDQETFESFGSFVLSSAHMENIAKAAM